MSMNLNIFDEFPRQDDIDVRNEEAFEWVALLESVADAQSQYTMLELGAGYGRWTARAAVALRHRNPGMPMRFIAVEAEPTHFAWMKEHLQTNKIDLTDCTLIQAPVSGKRETVHFTVGHPEEWYGQAIIPSADCGSSDWPKAKIVTMETVTIPDLIGDLDYVDLIDMDIQGAELPCLESSINELSRKVRRLFISTHSDEIHDTINAILSRTKGWHCHASYPMQRTHQTELGQIQFRDGIQYWENRTLGFRARR
jgi:FkbM family methyltransferase